MPKRTPTRTFTFPASDSELIKKIQSRCRKLDLTLNDSEVVRAGLAALMGLPKAEFEKTVRSIEKLRRGRPLEED